MTNEEFIQRSTQSLNSAVSSYKQAEQYYSALRNKFISQLPALKQDVGKEAWRLVINAINNKISNINYSELFTQDQKSKLSRSVAEIATSLISKNPNLSTEVSAATQRQTGKYSNTLSSEHQRIRNLSDTLQKSLGHYFDSNNIRTSLYAAYEKAFSITSNQASSTTQALYAMLRREIITQVLYGNGITKFINSVDGYINTFRGDLAEIQAEAALNEYISGISQRAGQIKIAGKETAYDLVIGNNATNIGNKSLAGIVENFVIFDDLINLNTSLLQLEHYNPAFMGGQVKSWYPPGSETKSSRANTSYLMIGSRADIYNRYNFGLKLPKGEKEYERGWHYSAEVLGKEILRVIGASNVFFITSGGKFNWTTDLIQTFRQAKYYLTFYYKRDSSSNSNGKYNYTYPGTTNVVWAQQKLKLHKRVKKF